MKEQHGPIMEDQSRARFGNYDIIRPIDTGGMGEVYLAHQRSAFGRPVAIKIIRSDLVHDRIARARFLREAEVSSHLKHEHILPLFEFGEDQGRLFLVTPYIEGGTLARRLQNGSLSLPEVRQLFVPLVQAVAYIHRRGVIHRDLKPSNILLDEQDGQIYVRLIDFGIASVQGRTASPPLTSAGNEVGTIAYMAPERLNGIAAPSNDIFSLGVILHQMLTGNLPMGEEFDPMPAPLDFVVRRCMAPRPEDRFASADEVLKNFERAYQVVTTSPTVQPSAPPVSPDPALTGLSSGRLTVEQVRRETASLQHSAPLPVVSPVSPIPTPPDTPAVSLSFDRADYGAPTTSFEPAKLQAKATVVPTPAPISRPPRNTGKTGGRSRKRSLMPLIWSIMIVMLLAIGALAYYGVQVVTATAVTVNFGPQVQALNKVYTVTATLKAQSVDLDNAIIPLKVSTYTQSGSKSGPTTGQANCGILCFEQGVSIDDVNGLATQIRPGLESAIKNHLQQQVVHAGGVQVSSVKVLTISTTSNPAVGQAGNTVTVTLTEQGSIVYFLNKDATSVARHLLEKQAQQMGLNYTLIGNTVVVGHPAVQSIDQTTGKVTIKIAAGGDVLYRFPASQLQTIHNTLKSKTVNAARAYLASQPGIDVQTINIHFTQGKSNTLPDDIQSITVVPLNANASAYPQIHLQNVPTLITPTA